MYKGILYTYKTDYMIGLKKNKKRGTAAATVKWKKASDPYKQGTKKSTLNFEVVERNVTADMVSFAVRNGKIKKLKVSADNVIMKPKKTDYSFAPATGGAYKISFKNNYKGDVTLMP